MLAALMLAGCVTTPDLPPADVVRPMMRPHTGTAVRLPDRLPPTPSVQTIIPPPSPALVFSREVMAAQILMDRRNFSCGCIDGKMGPQTRAALSAWQSVNGLPATGDLDDATWRKLGRADAAFHAMIVGQSDYDTLAPVPNGWVEKSKADRLAFETMLELLAERSHASQQGLRDLNPGVAWPDPPVGTEILAPNPRPFPWAQASRLVIGLGAKVLRVYDAGDRLIAWFPCSIARDKEKRPRGQLTVSNAAEQPTYLFDSNLFAEDPVAFALNRRLVIPPGPNNPVGVAWIGLDLPGYGIHGTPKPEDIGKTESHGCFRLSNWNAEKLIKMVAIGTPVAVED